MAGLAFNETCPNVNVVMTFAVLSLAVDLFVLYFFSLLKHLSNQTKSILDSKELF